MLDHLIHLAGGLGHWAYLVIFIVVVLECQALLGLIMPGESLVLLLGFIRVYLGAHYLSDVLRAAAAGSAWLVLSITGVDILRRPRHCQHAVSGAPATRNKPRTNQI